MAPASDKKSAAASRRSRSTGKRQLTLAWPSEALSLSTQRPTKRARNSKTTAVGHHDTSSALWTDLYAPKQAADLAVAPKKVSEIREWLLSEDSKLLILVGNPGVGKSTAVWCLANELNFHVLEWRESVQVNYNCHTTLSQRDSSTIEYESALTDLEHFLQQTAMGYTSLSVHNHQSSSIGKQPKPTVPKRSLVLLQDLPYCHTLDAQTRLRHALTQFVTQTTTIPIVLVYSNVKEGKHRPDDLERLIDPSVLYSQWVRILSIPVPTQARFTKCLQRVVAKAPGLSSSWPATKDWAATWHATCGGDIRHALLTLQLDVGLAVHDKKTTKNIRSTNMANRDQGLTAFHALGKLLYAKRKTEGTADVAPDVVAETKEDKDRQRQAPLQFDPEGVVEQSGMEVSRVLDFLRHNGPSFFTNVDELAHAWQRFSDAALWLQRSFSSSASNQEVFPTGYATCLAGRTVAHCNRQAAATKFRQLAGPPSWTSSAAENWNIMEHHWERELEWDGGTSVRHVVGRSTWAAERLAYQNIIAPHMSVGLQSFLGPSKAVQHPAELAAELLLRQQEAQAAILQDDDIEEFPEEDGKSITTTMTGDSSSPTSTTEWLPPPPTNNGSEA